MTTLREEQRFPTLRGGRRSNGSGLLPVHASRKRNDTAVNVNSSHCAPNIIPLYDPRNTTASASCHLELSCGPEEDRPFIWASKKEQLCWAVING